MEFKIRPARAEDYEKLPEIEAAADAVMNMVGLPEASSAAEYRQGKFVAVAQRSGRLCGLVRVDEVDGQAHLEQISVLPSDSGQGIGRALVETAKTWARHAGYQQMTLCTFRDVPFNAPFYARCGFAVLEEPAGELLELRKHEAELGLDQLGKRVAMIADLSPASIQSQEIVQ